MKARFLLFVVVMLCTTPAIAQSEQERYRANLDRALLSIGMDGGVSYKGADLTLFYYMDKPMVYQLITDGKVLDTAKAAGFKRVIFHNRGRHGLWTFDLTKPGNCDTSRQLCY